MDQSLVSIENNIPLADSRQIAEKLGIDHRSFFNLISEYQEEVQKDFGQVRFQIASVKTEESRGVKHQKYALLTEDQSYVYLAYSKNTEQARACKRLLVKAFADARQKLAQLPQEQIKQPQEQPQVHPLQGWEPNLPAGADELARAIRYEQAKLRFLQEAQAYHYPQKRKKHVGGADKMVSDVKQLPAPKQKTPEDIQSAIVRHLRKHGAMTRNQLHTRFLKNCDDLTLQVQLKALEAQGVVRKFDTVHAPEGKYALVQLEMDIS